MVPTALTDREREIVRLLAQDSGLSVSALSARVGVSAVTVRSDLNSLARKGVVVRTRGGAAPAFHPAIVERQNQRVEEKNRIAQAAAALVEDGDTIMIEAGTTTALVAKHLLGKRFVNIVTNSTLILPFARLNPGIHLTVVGGEFRPATESFVGPVALGELERFHVRLAFVGTDGFSLAGGLTTHLVEGAEIVRKMADRAETTILVADSAKFGRIGFVHVLPVSRLQRLISDAGLPAEARASVEETGVQVQLV
jgi:DeoR family galactitol utilization operon repressor